MRSTTKKARAAGRKRASAQRGTPVPGPAGELALPHERDQSPQAPGAEPDPMMVLASRDIDAGLVDTDMRATPGLDATRRARLVRGRGARSARGKG